MLAIQRAVFFSTIWSNEIVPAEASAIDARSMATAFQLASSGKGDFTSPAAEPWKATAFTGNALSIDPTIKCTLELTTILPREGAKAFTHSVDAYSILRTSTIILALEDSAVVSSVVGVALAFALDTLAAVPAIIGAKS